MAKDREISLKLKELYLNYNNKTGDVTAGKWNAEDITTLSVKEVRKLRDFCDTVLATELFKPF